MLYQTVKKLAYEKHIPITKIEDMIDVSQGSISKWDASKPSYDKVIKVAKILGVSVETLVEAEEK